MDLQEDYNNLKQDQEFEFEIKDKDLDEAKKFTEVKVFYDPTNDINENYILKK